MAIQNIGFNKGQINFSSQNKSNKTESTTSSEMQNGSERLQRALAGLALLNVAQAKIDEERERLNDIVADERKKEREASILSAVDEKTDDYNKRLLEQNGLKERLSNIMQRYPNSDTLTFSTTRQKQMNMLSEEQIAALDDEMLKSLLMYDKTSVGMVVAKYESNMESFDFLSELTPDEIIKIQSNPDCRYELIRLLNGNLPPKTEESYKEYLRNRLSE